MLDVYLLRHGQTSWNAAGNRYCGRTDIPLTEKGINQAELVRSQLEGIEFNAVYSSPLQRAYKTAEIACGGKKVIIDERLIEVDFGGWEGKTRAEFIEEDPGLWNNWDADPTDVKAGGTGETARDLTNRVDDFFHSVLQQHKTGSIMVVAHNGVNRLYLAHKLGMPMKHYRKLVQENSTVSMFQLDEDAELTLVHLNSKLK
ncbi:histidine phosphatase family protein [Segetibacter sp. 3557_3]|uniref:histidine phosphatase family protein n=1 Tax=Segetibacter sp. 3557_3 TaxID=2547429 RepID=UPI0010586122|nr:histidine phosphatase family protein [Segetibacter sp. 3557_3]TDH28653.1 histidine phosphatase family protein [Segetibacter sp. 3557_3]